MVGVIAAQSIGEPGTQLTLRTFHVGGVAGGTAVETNVVSKYEGRLEIDELRTVKGKNAAGESIDIVISRQSEFRIVDPKTDIVLYTHNLPYGATLFMADGSEVKKGDLICEWDPYNAVIISEYEGKASYESVIEGITYRDERDEQTGLSEKVVIESKDKTKNPVIKIVDKEGLEVKQYNLPVGAHVVVKDNAKIKAGDILIKIPRAVGKSGGDITGGLPRVAELFEARSPKDAGVLAEASGTVTFGKETKGKQRLIITDTEGKEHEFLIPKDKTILVHDGQVVHKGEVIVDGPADPHDILRLNGIEALARYVVDEVQDVYRLQGVKISDKHIEVIVRQMLKRVKVENNGDTDMLPGSLVDWLDFEDKNKAAIENGGEPAEGSRTLMGITKASLATNSFLSAASFQETTKVLTEAAIKGKIDPLIGMKENVIIGKLIPAGTGMKRYSEISLDTGMPEVKTASEEPEDTEEISVEEEKTETAPEEETIAVEETAEETAPVEE